MARLPSLFVSHGAPNLLLHNSEAKQFLEGFAARLPKPDAILVASAHFETAAPAVTADMHPTTVHDFNGFEPELYEITYPAPGAPGLANQAAVLLGEAGLSSRPVSGHGFDHGTWVPLSLMYPQADIPVVQLSVQSRLGPEHHARMGEALAPLADEGVLILGSGALTHNLHELFRGGLAADAATPAWVSAFGEWMREHIEAGDTDDLIHYRERAPFGPRNHPTEEHLLPLFVAMGASGRRPGTRVHTSQEYGVLMMDAYRFD
jgi:4,5-DOPA dioxygenase extradiol